MWLMEERRGRSGDGGKDEIIYIGPPRDEDQRERVVTVYLI